MKRMARVFEIFANPSSIHADGVEAGKALEAARTEIARVFGARSEEIYFTSGGTEALNIAITGMAYAAVTRLFPEIHIVTTTIEHAAISSTLELLERRGIGKVPVRVTRLQPDESGRITAKQVEEAIERTTVLIVVSHINGELGVVQPVRDIARAVSEIRKQFERKDHDFPSLVVDACQTPAVASIDRQKIGADVIVVDGSKCYGPKGVGVIMVKRNTAIEPLFGGGGQEGGLRSGTQNVAAACGLATALTECKVRYEDDAKRLCGLRDELIDGMLEIGAQQKIHIGVNGYWKRGDVLKRSAHIASFCVEGMKSELAVLRLDAKNISCAHASACSSKDGDGMSAAVAGFRPECASSTLRISLGRDSSHKDITRFLAAFAEIVKKC